MQTARGFSVVELMVTVALLAVMATLAAPALQALLQNNRAAAIANDLVSAIRLARSEAVTRAQQVTLCPTVDGVACADSTNWATGWLIRNSAGATVKAYPAITQATTGATLTGTRATLVFEQTGFLSGAEFTFSLRISRCRGDNNRDVVVRAQGRTEVTKVACT
ncbi:MAG TPA: GspH/FimT family pseudopilin [Nevskiales bacterium]|nr:GspH/FimT family pseudopilin [Nevskiales bacterium]